MNPLDDRLNVVYYFFVSFLGEYWFCSGVVAGGIIMLLKKVVYVLAFVAFFGAFAGEIPDVEKRDHLIEEWRKLSSGSIVAADLFSGSDRSDFKSGCVVLPVDFKGNDLERFSWDLKVDLDMTQSKGIAFDFFCTDPSAFASFSIYLYADGRWVQGHFSPDSSNRWNHVSMRKPAFKVDMSGADPGFFTRVTKIRISGWRGSERAATCALANVALIPFYPDVLLLQGDSCAKDEKERSSYVSFAVSLHQTLEELGVESVIISDTKLKDESLKDIKIAALPYNSSLPESVMPILKRFVERGGKVIAFYTLPTVVQELIGVKRGKFIKDDSGSFAGFSRVKGGLKGQPEFAVQRSWGAYVYHPDPDLPGGVVIANWRSGAGVDTGHPAIVKTAAGAAVGHVWLAKSGPERTALLMSLLGELAPAIWRSRAERAIKRVGVAAGYADYTEFCSALSESDLRPAAKQYLKEVDILYKKAARALKNESWIECVECSGKAQELVVKTWCANQSSAAGEHRAFWCHSAFGLGTNNWDESIRFLKEHGFNAILPNMSWGATAYYPSKVLPEYNKISERGDQIEQCLKACKKYGVECHVWKVNWNTGSRCTKEFAAQLRRERRLQLVEYGDKSKIWLCPSHPKNQQMEIDAMLEVVRNYDVDGVHFDYIRYPGSHSCFCDGCRERFAKYAGKAVGEWPACVKKGGVDYEMWLEFRRGNITRVVREVAQRSQKIRKGVEVSAAVFRNAANDRNSIGQDWQFWCEKGWLDFVCPMDYIDSNAGFKNVIESQKLTVGDVPLYPGIGLSCWKDGSNYAIKLCEQIKIARTAGLKGYTVFNYDRNAERVLPFLKLGITCED